MSDEVLWANFPLNGCIGYLGATNAYNVLWCHGYKRLLFALRIYCSKFK